MLVVGRDASLTSFAILAQAHQSALGACYGSRRFKCSFTFVVHGCLLAGGLGRIPSLLPLFAHACTDFDSQSHQCGQRIPRLPRGSGIKALLLA